MAVQNFFELGVWQEAHKTTLDIYTITKQFPIDEAGALVPQVRRAASLLPVHIVQGLERCFLREKIKSFHSARECGAELQNFVILAQDLAYITEDDAIQIFTQLDVLRSMLTKIIRAIGELKK